MNKVLLCVLDGFGIGEENDCNAVYKSKTPNIDYLLKNYPNSFINASGQYVGLPDNQMGNSEVGHLSIGAGRIIYQPLERINMSIRDSSIYNNKSILNAINHAKNNNSKLHIMGLLSDGGVHSHIDHFKAILKICSDNNFENVYFNIFTDGRDTYSNSSKKYIDELENVIDKYKIGSISTISGRYYAMDRDKRWDRIQLAYNSLIGKDTKKYKNSYELIDENYMNNITDEFIKPGIVDENGIIEDDDSIIWVNFRPDRAIQILSALINDDFNDFNRVKINNLYLTTMMYVSDNIKSDIAFKIQNIDNTLGIYLSKLGKKQLRIAETEKYAHVTYFFDGGKDIKLNGEKRILINSPHVKTYDLKPEMSAKEITESLLIEMDNNYDFILVNYANCDMVGHTGDFSATVKAIETVDNCIGKLYKKCLEDNYLFIITADHGNSELMIDKNNNKVTSHTTNKVPFIVCDKSSIINVDKLSDIAPFILNYLNLQIPDEMK